MTVHEADDVPEVSTTEVNEASRKRKPLPPDMSDPEAAKGK